MNDTASGDAENVRHDRDQARQELGRTVTELADKFDVRARAEDKVHETADTAREMTSQVRARAAHLADQVAAKTPAPVRDRGGQAVDAARRHRVTVTVATVSAIGLTWWALRRRKA
ncbi:DUF3618 domain-containing protein [Nocardia inohanensis]|uniref:DUF3618 domain-containing protein n=1 Tax=Nocardia inohanensis TaxID=209246 RepID=UPI000834505F|nr:DUF3618 domain-containing protein [Nocardia inohanensis]